MFDRQMDICFQRLGLTQNPFSVTPDTRFFYPSEHHTRALKQMYYGATNSSITLLTGGVGTGKTLLCRYFLKKTAGKLISAYLFNPLQSDADLLKNIYEDFGGLDSHDRTVGEWYKTINKLVIHHARTGKRCVIVIDEAHCLSVRGLEILRLLTNLETEKHKLLSIILVGQRELEKTLEDERLFALKQRINTQILLRPLSHREVSQYIKHRFMSAGSRTVLFSPIAIKLLALLSRGVPRVINKVSERALLAIFIKEIFRAGGKEILQSYYETRHSL